MISNILNPKGWRMAVEKMIRFENSENVLSEPTVQV